MAVVGSLTWPHRRSKDTKEGFNPHTFFIWRGRLAFAKRCEEEHCAGADWPGWRRRCVGSVFFWCSF